MKITFYGHSCFLIELNNKKLITDPFISDNPLAKKIEVDKIKTDYVLISHGHEDHIADALQIAKNNNATVISNFEIINWLTAKGVKKTFSMNIGGKHIFDFGTLTILSASHSSILPDGTYGGNPTGFLIESQENNFYFAGDTGLNYDMKLIGEYKKINFAFLPVGGTYTMDADDAIIASDFIKCDKIIGMHYNTFPVINIDKKSAMDKFKQYGKELILMNIGETIKF